MEEKLSECRLLEVSGDSECSNSEREWEANKQHNDSHTQPKSEPKTAPDLSSNTAPNLKSLIEFFDEAASKIEKPTVQLNLKGIGLLISRNSTNYKGKYPGCLNLHSDGNWLGSINREGKLFKSRDWQEWVKPILEEFAANPTEIARQHGKTTGACCFCNHKLTDPRSIGTGYGETCAKHYGLPWPLTEPNSSSSVPTSADAQILIPKLILNRGDEVKIVSARHGEEFVGIYGFIVDVTDEGSLVEVSGKKLFFEEEEIELALSELPF